MREQTKLIDLNFTFIEILLNDDLSSAISIITLVVSYQMFAYGLYFLHKIKYKMFDLLYSAVLWPKLSKKKSVGL